MLRLAIHIATGLVALSVLAWSIITGHDGFEIGAAFFCGWFCGKAHGCCTLCKHTCSSTGGPR
jgi:hypothetical protein